MKKAKMIGKKTLSVFLAVLMVLTAWVWVAPQKAEAVNAGTYNVRFSVNVTDKADSRSPIESSYWEIKYKTDNGTGSEDTLKIDLENTDYGKFLEKKESTTVTVPVPGFPTNIYVYHDADASEVIDYTITKIEIGGSTYSIFTSTSVAFNSGGWFNSAQEKNYGAIGSSFAPKASSIDWNEENTSDITLSSTGSTSYPKDFKYVIKDQYGVIMSDTALSNLKTPVSYSLQSTNFPTVSNTGNIGTSSTDSPNLYHTFTNGTSEYQVSVKVNDKLRSLEDGVNERKVNLKVTCGTLSSTKSFNIYDSKHTITFDKNATDASNMIPSSYKVYYGESLASQAVIDSASTYPTSGSRTGYTFLGMYDAATGGNLMNINAEVTANKTYYAHWEILKYAAVFMDRSGDNVVLVESEIKHGSPVTNVADATAKLNKVEFDDVNHYVLNESNVWTPSTDNVTGNTFFYPNYTATAHTFDSGTEISATCQHGAGMEYKCTGCDYSYVAETSETLGNHAKSDSYIVDTEATCTATGSGHYFCTTCNETVETVEIPAKGHSYKTEVTKNATCKETGNRKYTCTVCGDSYNEEIPLLPHDYKAGTTVAATCQHSAYTPYDCSGCDASYNKYEGNATTNHNWTFAATEDTVNNTVKVAGSCSICNASFTTEEFTLSHKHNFKNYEVTKQPNCKDTGEMKISCADNGCTESYTATLPAVPTAHTEYETIYTPATCSAKGSVVTKCKNCAAEIETTEIAKLNHSYNYVRVEPGCTTAGSITKTCANCGDVLTEEIPATGHKTVTVEANCQHGGYEKCGVCNTIISETSKKDHDFTGEVTKVEATCTVDGIEFTKCKNCDAQNAEKLTASGHSVPNDFTIIIPATCLGKGLKTKTCPKCNIVLDSKEIDPTGHNYQKDDKLSVPVTCTTAGKDVFVCKKCGDANTEVIQANGHTWIKIDEKAADCENKGFIKYECSACKTTEEEIIPALGHDWSDWTVVPSTNGSVGSVSRVCSRGCTESVEIPAGGHNLTETERTNSTCIKNGSVTYECKVNHKNGACGISVTVELPLAEHTIVTTEKPATCTESGFIKKYCSVEGCTHVVVDEVRKQLAHVYVAGTEVAPTCTTSGYTPYTCTCGDSYNDYDADKPAKGHDFDETITDNVTKVDATCTTDGSKTVKCKNCDVKNTVVLSKTGHNYVVEKTTDATCKEAATKTYKCKNANCGATYVEFVSGTVAHTFGNWTTIQDATTNSYGIKKRECSVCGVVEHETTDPTGAHDFKKNEEKAATCTAEGYIKWVCNTHTNCEANYTETLDKLPHTQKIDYKAPTCVADGYSKVVCSVCSAEIMSAEILAKGHAYNTVKVTKEPGCESTGTRTYSCSCGASYTEEIPAKGHAFKTEVNDATCESTGTVVTTCENCTSYKETITLAAKNHNWNAGVENPKATCTSEGTITYTCTVDSCGETKTETVEKLDHEWNEWTVTPSTNGKEGSVSRKCKNCTETETVVIPAGGHNLVVDEDNSTDATCTSEGTLVYKCENHTDCGITVSVNVPKTQHILENVKTDAECEKLGSVVTRCTKCNVDLITTIIPAKGHTITVTVTPATCTTDGSVVEYCEECKTTLKTTTIAKLIHDYSGTETIVTKATCTTDGEKKVKCKTCDATTNVVIPKLGHSWNGWVKKEATNDTDGSWSRECTRKDCDAKENLTIPKGGHNLVEDKSQYKAPTCTDKGQKVYACNNTAHENCTVTVTVELDYGPHTIAQKIEEASCTQEGSVKAYCSVCDVNCTKPFSIQTIPVKAHVYKAGTEVAPTCTTSGYTPYTCSCGDSYNKYDESKPATGHDLVEGTSTATCVGAGEMTLSCNNSGCNYSRTVNVPALGHDYGKIGSTTATCAAAATETYKCSRCTASYTISVGEKSTDHTWDESKWQVQVSATPSSLGYKTNACTVCGQIKVETIPATGEHNFNKENSRQDATCTADGWIKYECSTHKDENDCKLTSIVTIPANGHTEKLEYTPATCESKGSAKRVCTVETCKEVIEETEIPALGHLYGEGTVANATCKDTGKIEYTCTRENCNDTHTTIIEKNSNAHQYVTVVKDSTCTVPGKVSTKCNLCGNQIEVKTLPLIEHTWNDGEIKEGDNATCTADGKKTFTCTAENCTATKTETIAKLGHAWGEWTETKASTNNDKGVLTRTCSRGCTETAEIPEGGHNLVVDSANSKVPSCTESGYTKYICNVKHTGDVDCGITVTVTLDKLQHKLETTKTDATCEKEGSVVTKCTKCETSTFTTTIPATGHTYNEGVKTDATCTKEGKIVYTCTADKCGKTKEVILDKLQHNYVAGTPVAATCTSSGYTPYKCATCESEYVIITSEAKTHTFVKDSSSATCTDGGKMILKCACGVTMETDVPALGHDYELKSTTTATCKDDATETYKCSRCDSGYTVSVAAKTDKHNMTWETVAATNTSLGYNIGTCSDCGKVTVEIIPATGEHVFDKLDEEQSYAATCTADGLKVYSCSKHENCTETSSVVIPKLGHTEQLIYSAATCTSEGSASIYCDVCKTTLSTEKIPVLNHVWGDEVITQPTCNSTGSVVFKCGGANCTETKTVIIPENENAHKLTMDAKLATCKEAGYVKVTCTNEGCTYEEKTTLPMLHHDWSTWTKTDSTNDKAGSWVSECSICKDKKSLEIPKGGHKFGDIPDTTTPASCTAPGTATYNCTAHTGKNACGVAITVTLAKTQHEYVTNTVDASCSKEGSVTVSCRVCGDKLVDNMATAKLPHTYEETETKATCTKAGYITYTCKKCGDSYDKFVSQPIGHTYTKVTTDPTCTTVGYTTYKCSVCGQGYTSDFVEANGHKYNEGEKTDATCTTAGKIVYTCTAKNCGHSYEVTLSMLNHEYDVENTVDPTCTANGYTTYKCKTCDSSYVVIGDPAKTHNYSTVVSSTATCTAGGTLTLKCTDCEQTMETAVPALGHNYVENIKRATDATCAAAATKTFECEHSNCNAEYTVSVGAKTDVHDWNDWFTVKEADYTSIGYKTRTCKVCGKLEVETINATGAHDLQEVKRDAPTCTAKGKIYYECQSHSDCGIKNEVEIPALGHDEKLSYKAATCTEAGFTKIICNVEGCDYEADVTTIPALGHAWDDEAATIVNATCKSEGSVSLGCKNCNKTTEVVIPVNADAHKTVVTTNKATCTEAGSVVTSCELCKKELLTTTLTALGHDWSTWDINPSTYTAPGSMSRICQTCKEPEIVEIPAGGHKFNNVPSSTTAATCEAEGSATYKCSAHVNCGVEVTVKLSKVHHNLKIDTVDASCTNGGSITVSCVNCNYTSIITTGILAHEYQENGTVAATCTTAGYTIMKCKNCDATYNRFDSQPLGHNFDDSIADNVTIVAAKCEEDGSKTVKCSRKDCDETKITVIPATGHKYENEKSSVTTAPTCTEMGYTTYTCDVCKVSYTTNFVKPKGHDWGDWMVASGADGDVIKRVCKTDANHTEQYNIPSGGHSFDTTKPAATVQGTCQAEGSMKFNCTAHENCGVTITVNTGFGSHNWSQWEIKAATNEADGSWTHKCLISGCNESETLVIPRGHYLAEDSKQYVKPECNKVGQRVYTCTAHDNCTVKIVVVLEMTQHTIVTVNEAATCQNDGLIKTYCEKCEKVFSDITLKKVPHDYDKNKDGKLDTADAVYTAPVQNADGTWTPGYYTFTCQTAGCEDTKVEGDSTSYEVSFFDGNGDLVATTIVLSGLRATAPAETPAKDADGNYHYTFSGWDRDFSKIEKDLDVYATFEKEAHFGGEATCNTKAICDNCNKAYGNVDESKHIIVTKSKSASCEADGWVEYYCTSEGCEYNYNTGKYLKKETIGASGHVYGQWKVVQNGTCEIPQIQQRKCINYGCNKVEEKLSQSTHTWLLEPRIEPTCSSVGYTEFKYCVTCNLQIDRVEIPKIDHRDLDGNGYCDYCGTSKGTPKCSCMCHSTGIMKFFYKIVRFFWMITKSSRSCSCGAVHY